MATLTGQSEARHQDRSELRLRAGRPIVAILMVGYALAAFLGPTIWFPLTGSTPTWYPTLEVGLGIVVLWVAVGVARGAGWSLVPAAGLSLVAMVWTATWLDETLSWYLKVIAVGVPLTIVG